MHDGFLIRIGFDVYRRLTLLVAVFVAGCGGTYLSVHVQRSPDRAPIAGASVLLYDLKDDPCRDSPSGGQGTDSAGHAEVRAHDCGPTRLYVSAQGFEPIVRGLDSCSARAIDVVLTAQQPDAVGGGASLVALQFVDALLTENIVLLRELLMDPGSAEAYLIGGIRESGRPDAVRVIGTTDAPVAAISLELLYDTGCRAVWRCLLKLDGSEWRVLELAPAPSARVR